ncbi:DEKNAAC102488 [Brettanomyces naardenensis]|uniref:DEKNAAC102488 n=1 Tax=Brettanomyces naardenensis TaxID=13370 RepID=A0A448YL42_BRENA|nr:DEKNAAC102488 [Brettanomyces naardenensis]
MVSHQGGRTVVGYYSKASVMMGKRQLGSQFYGSHAILAFSMLPVGTFPQLTDSMGVLAILTPEALIVVSTLPSLQMYFKLGRSRSNDSSQPLTGSVAWYPATSGKSPGNGSNMPLLAYCWQNVLSLFEVSSETITDSFGHDSVIMKFENRRHWTCTESIVSMRWLNSKIITVLTKSQRLIFIGKDKFKVLSTVDLISKHVKSTPVYEGNEAGLYTQSYANTFKALKSNVFILGRSSFYIGTLNGWADVLFSAIKDGRYIEALEDARRQFQGDCDLALLGLPQNDQLRHELMYDHIVKILAASLNYLFEEASNTANVDLLERFLVTALHTCATINSGSEIYEELYDRYSSNGHEDLFFACLETPLLNEQIRVIPPAVFHRLVEYYVAKGNGEVLEDLLCRMDLSQLDIDLTLRLCRQHHLTDSLVYIWNVLLHDYVTPVFDAIRRLKNLKSAENYDDIDYVFPYISYILTGRQYPTDRPIEPNDVAQSAKLNIYYVLFNGGAISYPSGTEKLHVIENVAEEPSFPYLYILLEHDSFRLLSSLNEALEDELLNEDEVTSLQNSGKPYELKVNRQYIVDVLLGIFHQNDGFTAKDRTYLAVFIARNYPKYTQFIRLSDSILNEVIEDLCSYPDDEMKDECELSLQSLLSVYRPANYDSLIAMFESCGFHNALFNIYRSENKHLQILEMWVKERRATNKVLNVDYSDELSPSPEPFEESLPSFQVYHMFESIPAMLKECLRRTASNAVSHAQIERLIEENFDIIIRDYPEEMAEIFSIESPSLNASIFRVPDCRYKYRYLRQVTQMELTGRLPYKVPEELDVGYASLLSRFDHDQLASFVTRVGGIQGRMQEFLEQHQEVEIIAQAYEAEGKFKEAVTRIVDAIDSLGLQMIESSLYSEATSKRLLSLLELGFRVLKGVSDKENANAGSGLTLSESLLLQLIEVSVKLFVIANERTSSKDVPKELLKIFKRLTQTSFTKALAEKQDCSDSFLRVFYEFLNRSSLKVTTLADVRPVLNEIFLSYSHDEVILNLIFKLLNDDIYKDLINWEQLKLQGWSPVHIECEVCGKKIWGPEISPSNFEVWQDHKLGVVDEDQKIEKSLQICVFQCRHGYHTKCLENMGVTEQKKYCIICEVEKKADE